MAEKTTTTKNNSLCSTIPVFSVHQLQIPHVDSQMHAEGKMAYTQLQLRCHISRCKSVFQIHSLKACRLYKSLIRTSSHRFRLSMSLSEPPLQEPLPHSTCRLSMSLFRTPSPGTPSPFHMQALHESYQNPLSRNPFPFPFPIPHAGSP